jgi:pSer/pThr/pTyr-binding forkhead associated (FHA) protein
VTGVPAAELEILTGPLAGRRLELRGETTVGRADTDLELSDGEVSRLHAVVRVQPDATVEVEDLGSTNGTYVDEQSVTGATVLRPGSQLRIGSTVLRLRGGTETVAHDVPPPTRVNRLPPGPSVNQMRFAPPTVRRRHGERSAALLMGPTVLTFVAIGLTALALLVYFVAR